jgi:hypothetical protein
LADCIFVIQQHYRRFPDTLYARRLRDYFTPARALSVTHCRQNESNAHTNTANEVCLWRVVAATLNFLQPKTSRNSLSPSITQNSTGQPLPVAAKINLSFRFSRSSRRRPEGLPGALCRNGVAHSRRWMSEMKVAAKFAPINRHPTPVRLPALEREQAGHRLLL